MKEQVWLRPMEVSDLPTYFQYQMDPEANAMAVTRPRSPEAFAEHWAISFNDPDVNSQAIMVGDEFAGCVACLKLYGEDSVGYWLGRQYWGRGIGTQAVRLLLTQVTKRPLYARVATTNQASQNILLKCGFEIIRYEHCPESDRYPECDEAVLRLS